LPSKSRSAQVRDETQQDRRLLPQANANSRTQLPDCLLLRGYCERPCGDCACIPVMNCASPALLSLSSPDRAVCFRLEETAKAEAGALDERLTFPVRAAYLAFRSALERLSAISAATQREWQFALSLRGFEFDTDRRELHRGTDLVSIEPLVFDLLDYLIRNKERVVSKDDPHQHHLERAQRVRCSADNAPECRPECDWRFPVRNSASSKPCRAGASAFVGTVQEGQRRTV